MESNGTNTTIPLHTGYTIKEDPIDFVLVWDGSISKTKSEKSVHRRKIFEANLEQEGLQLERHSVKAKNLNFVIIRAPLEVLKRYGEILKFRMPIKEIEGVTNATTELSARKSIIMQRATNCCGKLLTLLCGLDSKAFPANKRRVTTVYSRDKHYLFDEDAIPEYFTPAVRSRIVEYILKRKRYKEGDENHEDDLAFGFERLINYGTYTSGYPLHDGDYRSPDCQRGLLYKEWASFRNIFRHQPLDAIKNYFGPKIGIYYAWLGYYAVMLIPASILGIICFVYGLATVSTDTYTKDICNSEIFMCPLCDTVCSFFQLKKRCFDSWVTYLFDNESTAIYAFIMSIWTVIFLEFWKRYSSEIFHTWDLTGYDENDLTPRPEYLAKLKKVRERTFNYVTNTMEPAIPFWKMKLPYTLASFSTMLLLLSVAIASVAGVVFYRLSVLLSLSRHAANKPELNGYSLYIVSFSGAAINVMFILVFTKIYERIAKFITEIEIPRTQQDYEASYSFKIFVLEFINHYASIFYIAFIKGNFVGTPNNYNRIKSWRQEECGISCMTELCIQLGVVMIGKQAKNALVEMFTPCIRRLYRKVKLRVTKISEHSIRVMEHQITKDYELLDWTSDLLTDEYLEMVLQFGFVTIFVSAFPLAPFFALINNWLEVRIDAQKLLKYYKRPVWCRTRGIGIWFSIMDSLSKFAVLSNALIIAITSNFIPKLVFRFTNYSKDDPNYGSLHGFLNYTLTAFSISEIDAAPAENVRIGSLQTCSFSSMRHGHGSSQRYNFKETHWQVWLARVVFILIFENLVAVAVMLISLWIPDTPAKIKSEIQREEFITNELIIQQELLKARGIMSDETMQIFQRVLGFTDDGGGISESEPEPEPDPEIPKKRKNKSKQSK